MNGSFVIDTNAVIAFRAGNKDISVILLNANQIYVPAVVLGELLYGAKNSGKVDYNIKAVTEFIANTTLLPIDEITANIYSDIRTSLKSIGKPIPENDIWIAASALKLNLPLITVDKHFRNIIGINIIGWKEI